MKKVMLTSKDPAILINPEAYIAKRKVNLEDFKPYVIFSGVGIEARGWTPHYCDCEYCEREYDETTGYYKDEAEARDALCESDEIEIIGSCFYIRIVQQDQTGVFP